MRPTLLAALALLPLATLSPRAASAPAPAGPGAVVSMHVQLFRALDGGDAERAASFVGPVEGSTLFLQRAAGAEVVRGRERVAARLAAWADEAEPGAFETRITTLASDCYSEHLSYAVLEIERTRGEEVERFLSTSLVQYRGGGWKLMHWHLSPAPERSKVAAK